MCESGREGEAVRPGEGVGAFQRAEWALDRRAQRASREVHPPLPAAESAVARVVGDHRHHTPRPFPRLRITPDLPRQGGFGKVSKVTLRSEDIVRARRSWGSSNGRSRTSKNVSAGSTKPIPTGCGAMGPRPSA